MFEYGVGGYYPVGFLMEPGLSDPPVIIGDDHGACWTDSRHHTFETYLESLLAGCFTNAPRRAMVGGARKETIEQAPLFETVDFESLLPEPVTLTTREDGATFEARVVAIEELPATDARAQKILESYAVRLNQMAKLLGEKAPSKMPRDEVARLVAERTADLRKVDAKTAGKLCTLVYAKGRTKKALGEKLFSDLRASTKVALEISPVFDTTGIGASSIDSMVADLTPSILAEHASIAGATLVSAEGRGSRVCSIEALVSGDHTLKVGESLTASTIPNGFIAHDGAVYRMFL